MGTDQVQEMILEGGGVMTTLGAPTTHLVDARFLADHEAFTRRFSLHRVADIPI